MYCTQHGIVKCLLRQKIHRSNSVYEVSKMKYDAPCLQNDPGLPSTELSKKKRARWVERKFIEDLVLCGSLN